MFPLRGFNGAAFGYICSPQTFDPKMMHRKKFNALFFFALFAFGFTAINAQEKNEAALKTILATKTFVFKAQSAWPLQGNTIQLTPGFDMKVFDDSINTYLPYYGRAYQAGYTNNGGISFTSTKFEYRLKDNGKKGWELIIKPADVKEINQLIYSVATSGYATLQVTSNNRQAISFYGIIEKTK